MRVFKETTTLVHVFEVVLRLIGALAMAHVEQVDLIDIEVLNNVDLWVFLLMLLFSFFLQECMISCVAM
jgi:hypothetical protein